MCFADDLFIYANGDIRSIELINRALDHFKGVSGLKTNLQKSEIYFFCVEQNVKSRIMKIMGFKEGTLPVKYLALPLISSRMKKEYCQEHISKITSRIQSWNVKTVPYGGRLQVVISVLSSMQVYWCIVFVLPKAVINEMEKLCRNFLWHGNDGVRRGGLLAWKKVCQQKEMCGQGAKPFMLWNQAMQMKHTWELIQGKKTL